MLARLGRPKVQGILLDLGVSSLQIDDPARGFAYAQDAPLDMRMGRQELTAAQVLSIPTREQNCPESCEPTARSGTPTGLLGGSSPSESASLSSLPADSCSCCTTRSRGFPQDQRSSCEAHFSGSPDRGQRRAGIARIRAAECHRGARASRPDRRPTTRWRTGWSSKSSALPLGIARHATFQSSRRSSGQS